MQLDDSHSVSLGMIIGGFKAGVTRGARSELNWHSAIWQREYYEHIVRNEQDRHSIREYIATNPARWAEDRPWRH